MEAVTPLAAQVVAILTPFLPQLAKAGQALAEQGTKAIEEHGWDLAKELWGRVEKKTESKPVVADAAKDLTEHPDDEDFQAAFRAQLKKLFAEDPAFADELRQVIETSAHAPGGTVVSASGQGAVAIGGGVQGSSIVTGNQNTLG